MKHLGNVSETSWNKSATNKWKTGFSRIQHLRKSMFPFVFFVFSPVYIEHDAEYREG